MCIRDRVDIAYSPGDIAYSLSDVAYSPGDTAYSPADIAYSPADVAYSPDVPTVLVGTVCEDDSSPRVLEGGVWLLDGRLDSSTDWGRS